VSFAAVLRLDLLLLQRPRRVRGRSLDGVEINAVDQCNGGGENHGHSFASGCFGFSRRASIGHRTRGEGRLRIVRQRLQHAAIAQGYRVDVAAVAL
jgi:hypothetical protein